MKVLYCGSFSPWHKGHQYVYDIACKCFGKENVWIGVGENKDKPLRSFDAKFVLAPITKNVITYKGLTAKVVNDCGFDLLIRGIRIGKSLEQEEELLHWNKKLCGTDTILIPTPSELNHISSSVIRELDFHNIDVSEYVNLDVFHRWKNRNPSKYIYFGRTCSGKTTYLKQNMLSAVNCDESIWHFIKTNDMELLKHNFKNAFYAQNKETYNTLIKECALTIDWDFLFGFSGTRFDMAVLGVYWKYIPIEIRSQFKLIKIETFNHLRNEFIKKREVSEDFVECADFFYKDPPFWDETVLIV